jgi:hypothetical protein
VDFANNAFPTNGMAGEGDLTIKSDDTVEEFLHHVDGFSQILQS